MSAFRVVFALVLVAVTLHKGTALHKDFSKEHIGKCEYDALRLGTGLGDVFNLPIDTRDWSERVHQNFIAKHLGFAPWLKDGVKGSKKTLTADDIEELRREQGWIAHNSTDSPYAVLNNKWIYMFGDSTTRQVWASFAASFQGNNFERNAKEWTRQYCNKQAHRVNHPKNGVFPEEGWEGPCGVNEVTCYISGYGDGGLLTFDWKHFPYEDYDDHIFGDTGLWHADPAKAGGDNGRRPDVLTLQTGMHTCWHAHPDGFYSKKLTEFNETMYNHDVAGLDKLFAATRAAVDRRAVDGVPATQVIVLTSGATYKKHGTTAVDECILRINRKATDLAHKYNFAVLERGEIERRFMYKSVYTENAVIDEDMHLPMPGQTIVATALLNLLTCLSSDPKKLGIKAYIEHQVGGSNMQPQQFSAGR